MGRSSVWSLRMGPLLVAIAICVLFSLFGNALIGESLGTWYDTVEWAAILGAIVFRAVIITGAIAFLILAVMLVLPLVARATLTTEYIEFALALGMFLVIIAGSYWFVVRGQGRRM